MKLVAILAILMSSFSSFAYSNVSALCESDRGVELEITISAFESLPPPHLLSMSFRGQEVLSNELIREVRNNNFDAAFTGRHPERTDVEIFVGVDAREQSIYYQESANNGMSPLPGTFFDNCIVELSN